MKKILLFPWENFFPTYIGSKAKLREKNKEKKNKSVGTFFPLVTNLGSKTAGDAGGPARPAGGRGGERHKARCSPP